MGSSYCGLTVEKLTLYEESARTHRNKRKYTGKWKLAVLFAGKKMKTIWRIFQKLPSADEVEDKVKSIADQLVLDAAAETDPSAAALLVQPAMGEVQGMKFSVYEFIIIVDCCIITFISAALSLQLFRLSD